METLSQAIYGWHGEANELRLVISNVVMFIVPLGLLFHPKEIEVCFFDGKESYKEGIVPIMVDSQALLSMSVTYIADRGGVVLYHFA